MKPVWALTLPALALGGGYLGFRYACLRGTDPDWEDPVSLQQSDFAEFSESIPLAAQWLRKHHAEDVFTVSHDGLRLAGKWVPAEGRPKGTIILFHGYRSHYLNDFAAIFSMYHSMGLNLLLVRQRSHGESEGKYITFGVRERQDVRTWVEFHNRTHGMDNVFLGGLSMGASTVLFAAELELPPNVRAITADCGFTCPKDIMAQVIRKRFHLPPAPVLPLIDFWARILGGFSISECDSRKILTHARLPILFIHGKADGFVPCGMSQEGYDACCSQKELYLVEGADHGRSYLYEPERLTAGLVDFFNRNISDDYS